MAPPVVPRPLLLPLLLLSSSLRSGASASPLWADFCAPGDGSSNFPFCDSSLSPSDRASDLIGRLSLDEKGALLDNSAVGVPRLGLPPYQWWSEGLHGPLEPCVADPAATNVTTKKCPTSFPAPSAMASAFNDTLYRLAGSVTGVEGRSISNVRVHDGKIGDGLTYWAPNANMQRDPRWGRNMEAPGEDPVLSSRYISNYVRGMQEGDGDEDGAQHVLVAATCKHFLANELEHSVVNGTAVTRHDFDAEIPLPELRDYYLPAFEACVKRGRALGIMCSYNSVNGVPMCVNEHLLTNVLRGGWGFDGYVTSDCGAIADVYQKHRFVPDGPTAAAAGLRAGCDTDCGSVYGDHVVEAVESYLLSEETIDASLRRLVGVQMRLGLFDPKDGRPYFDPSEYGIERIDAPSHRRLAYEAAVQSIVLLKNDNDVLPLKKGSSIAVVGPHVLAREAFLSNYHGERCPQGGFDCVPSPLEAIVEANAGGTVTHARGCEVDSDVDEIHLAVAAARDADVVVLLAGIDESQEREEHDRSDCGLPGLQPNLVRIIAALGKPTVLVLVHGGALCLGPLKDDVPAIVDASYGGESAAPALAAVLFGDENPSGKLAATMYPPEYMRENPITTMSVTKPPGRTHLYYKGTPEFAFGTGLSYSSWTIEVVSGPRSAARLGGDKAAAAAAEIDPERFLSATADYSVRLTNSGPLPGRQRVLAFVRFPRQGEGEEGGTGTLPPGTPRRRLWGYDGVSDLGTGESVVLTFSLDASEHLAVADGDGDRVLHPGEYAVYFSDGTGEEVEADVPLRVVGRPAIVEESIFRRGAPGEGGSEGEGETGAAPAVMSAS